MTPLLGAKAALRETGRQRKALRWFVRKAAMRFSLLAAALIMAAASAGFVSFAVFRSLTNVVAPEVAGLITGCLLMMFAGASWWFGIHGWRNREVAGGEDPPRQSASNQGDMLAGAAFAVAFVLARQWAKRSVTRQ